MNHECIIGMYNDYENTDLITYSEICEMSLSEWKSHLKYEDTYKRIGIKPPTRLEDYFDKRKNTELTRFDYCPVCGKKIDWNKLKMRCKDNA